MVRANAAVQVAHPADFQTPFIISDRSVNTVVGKPGRPYHHELKNDARRPCSCAANTIAANTISATTSNPSSRVIFHHAPAHSALICIKLSNLGRRLLLGVMTS
jgi:hypothetical protein